MNKVTKIITPILVIIGAIVLVQVMVASKPEPEKKENSQRSVSLYVAPVEKTKRSIDVETQGEVKAKNQIPLTARVSGHVIEISPDFEEGAAIDSDTLLLKIDDTDYKT
ncbi:MAG: efflux RND transporter periplasmic adaptor subunit, partial [Proteobacteria bacterium]|nr:efflux RND transporter periplasmic adaptor subunit [Pseudomonadota bacterium]